jgi:hypothetical protein
MLRTTRLDKPPTCEWRRRHSARSRGSSLPSPAFRCSMRHANISARSRCRGSRPMQAFRDRTSECSTSRRARVLIAWTRWRKAPTGSANELGVVCDICGKVRSNQGDEDGFDGILTHFHRVRRRLDCDMPARSLRSIGMVQIRPASAPAAERAGARAEPRASPSE